MTQQQGRMTADESSTPGTSISDSLASGGAATVLAGDEGTPRGSLGGDGAGNRAERGFKYLTYAAATIVVAAISLIAVYLIVQAIPAIGRDKVNFLTSSEWTTTPTDNMRFGVLDLLKVTLMTSVLALVLAVPVSVGIATFLVQYVPSRLSRILGTAIDLLAAVPSIVYGLWGFYALGPWVEPVARWLNKTFGWFFLFSTGNVSILSTTVFVAGIVLGIMICRSSPPSRGSRCGRRR